MPAAQKRRLLYLASRNHHKLEELAAIIDSSNWDIRLATDLDPSIDWEENGITFMENALIKAKTVKRHTGGCVLADDSGLEVEALDGKPGIYSQRFAGLTATDANNNQKLLTAMHGVSNRKARFVCALAFINEDGESSFYDGFCTGEILLEARGQGGFGYDPLFYIPALGKSFAELSEQEKNQVSHRAKALQLWRDSISPPP